MYYIYCYKISILIKMIMKPVKYLQPIVVIHYDYIYMVVHNNINHNYLIVIYVGYEICNYTFLSV